MKLTNEMIELVKIILLAEFKNIGFDLDDVYVNIDTVALGDGLVSHLLAHCRYDDSIALNASMAFVDYKNNLIIIGPNGVDGYSTNNLVDFITVLPNGKLKFDDSCINKNIAYPGLMYDLNECVINEQYLKFLRKELIG